MSSASLQGGASGSGQMTLLVPNTNSNRTVTFPDVDGQAMVNSNMPAFSAYRSAADQGFSQATWTKVALNAEDFDTNSNYDTSTYRFTPTVAGYYQINASCYVYPTTGTNNTNQYQVSIYKNGSAFKGVIFTFGSSYFNQGGIPISSLIYMNGSTDYLELYVFSNTPSPIIYSQTTTTFLNGSLVRSA